MGMLGWDFVKRMVLKRGDFIEDKFGQVQRKTFIELRRRGSKSEIVRRALDWFGCWLIWMPRRTDGGHAWTLQASYIDVGSESQQIPVICNGTISGGLNGAEGSSDDGHAEAAANQFSDSGCSEEDVSSSGQQQGIGYANPNPPAMIFVSHMRGRTLGFVNPDHRVHLPDGEIQTGRRSERRRKEAQDRHSLTSTASIDACEYAVAVDDNTSKSDGLISV